MIQEPQSPALAQDLELLAEFLVESRQHLASIETQMLALERAPTETEPLHCAFRAFHTIKGLAGFLEFAAIQQVAHEAESLLDLARSGTLSLETPHIEAMLAAGDYLRQWLDFIGTSQKDTTAITPPEPLEVLAQIRHSVQAGGAATLEMGDGGEPEHSAGARPQTQFTEASLVRVDNTRLEYLLDMAGELVVAQSILRNNPELAAPGTRLQRDLAQLAHITAEVQKTAMVMRMVPVGQLFRKMSRLVRDLSRKSGKLAELELIGEDVEIDRTIVEELADPLMHMLRNSADHGLESPEEREARGKPQAGKIRLKAAHQAGQIVIEISDDGRGLNRDAVLAKALSRGLIRPGQNLSDQDIYRLIFEPGFSTTEKITDVSGRGVGMDVVRRNIEKLRGSIEIKSQPGAGTTFLLRFPLTLAIIDGLVVVIGEEQFIVPLFAVLEVICPAPGMISKIGEASEMALVRDRLMPFVRLYERLGLVPKSTEPSDGVALITERHGKPFALLVDRLAGKQEVVIKGLGPALSAIPGIAGGAVLGDGRVSLVLDLAEFTANRG